jgi:signal transduction histidine kinase
VRPSPGDAALAAGVCLLALFAPVTGGSGHQDSAGWVGLVAIVAAIGQGVPLLWRTTHPVACSAVVLVSYAVACLVVGLTPPLGPWVMIWSTGSTLVAQGLPRRLPLLTTVATCLLIGVSEVAQPGVGASALLVALTVLVALSAVLVRTDRGRVEAVRERAATQERLRIARDLHDVVGHGLSVVAVQSSTARLALDAGDPGTARTAIGVVEAASRTAMREMRQMLGVLTERPEHPGSPGVPGIADIDDLVNELRAGGVQVSYEVSGPWDQSSPAVQLCVYRVVQEATTNAVKHCPGQPISILVESGPDELSVCVANAGTGPQPADGGGMGLPGLRARVDAEGGRFHAGPTSGGWQVEASLPIIAEVGR